MSKFLQIKPYGVCDDLPRYTQVIETQSNLDHDEHLNDNQPNESPGALSQQFDSHVPISDQDLSTEDAKCPDSLENLNTFESNIEETNIQQQEPRRSTRIREEPKRLNIKSWTGKS